MQYRNEEIVLKLRCIVVMDALHLNLARLCVSIGIGMLNTCLAILTFGIFISTVFILRCILRCRRTAHTIIQVHRVLPTFTRINVECDWIRLIVSIAFSYVLLKLKRRNNCTCPYIHWDDKVHVALAGLDMRIIVADRGATLDMTYERSLIVHKGIPIATRWQVDIAPTIAIDLRLLFYHWCNEQIMAHKELIVEEW